MENTEWAEHLHCAVTVCDTEGTIIYMNDKSRNTFAKHGNLIGKNLFDCHSPESQKKIRQLLATDGTNSYTIEKEGQKKDDIPDHMEKGRPRGRARRDIDGDTRRHAPLHKEVTPADIFTGRHNNTHRQHKAPKGPLLINTTPRPRKKQRHYWRHYTYVGQQLRQGRAKAPIQPRTGYNARRTARPEGRKPPAMTPKQASDASTTDTNSHSMSYIGAQ